MLKKFSIVSCPFCNSSKIELIEIPSVKKYQKGPWGGNKAYVKRTEERIIILSDKCPNCGKTKKEIEHALKHGKELSREEVLKRLREAGLNPSKLK